MREGGAPRPMTSRALHARSAIGRADLLRVLAAHGEAAMEQLAAALGYERELVEISVASPPALHSFVGRVDSRLVPPRASPSSARLPCPPPACSRSRRTSKRTLPSLRGKTRHRSGCSVPGCCPKTLVLTLARFAYPRACR